MDFFKYGLGAGFGGVGFKEKLVGRDQTLSRIVDELWVPVHRGAARHD